jgi:hypothetical protein
VGLRFSRVQMKLERIFRNTRRLSIKRVKMAPIVSMGRLTALRVNRQVQGLRFSSTEAQGQKTVSPHVRLLPLHQSNASILLLDWETKANDVYYLTDWFLQDFCATYSQSPAYGDVYVPIGVLGVGEAGEG